MKPSRGVLITLGLLAALGLSWPLSHGYRHARSQQLIAQTKSGGGESAIANLEVARRLDPGHAEASYLLAELYLKSAQSGQAKRVLGRLPRGEQGSARALVIKSQIELESGNLNEALALAKQSNDRQQLALSYAAGNRAGELAKLVTGTNDPALKKIAGGATPLAQHMYDRGLLNSARRYLEMTEDSGAKYLLLARITMRLQDDREWLNKAKNYAEKGIEVDPGSLELHRLLLDIYRRQNDQESARHEAGLIKELEAKY